MKFKEKINKNFDTFETIALIIFAAGLVAYTQELIYAKYIFIAGTATLTIIYLIKSSTRDQTKKILLHKKIGWYSLAITPPAIYAKMQMLQKSNSFLLLTIALLTTAIIIKIFEKYKNKKTIPLTDFIRIIIAIIITLFIFALPLPNIKT